MTSALLAERPTAVQSDAVDGHAGIAAVDLRAARERRGLSLERISVDTKIPRALLEALEAGKLDQFPQGIYARAYARAYAAAVGLSSDAVLAALADRLPEEESLEQIAHATPRSVESSKRLAKRGRARLAVLVVSLAGLLVVTGAWALGPRVTGLNADQFRRQAKPTAGAAEPLQARAIIFAERTVQIPAAPSRTALESALETARRPSARERLPLEGTAPMPTMAAPQPNDAPQAPEPLAAQALVTPMVGALPGPTASSLSNAGAEPSNTGNRALRGLRKVLGR